jgi:SAM-dependent methyltransferase
MAMTTAVENKKGGGESTGLGTRLDFCAHQVGGKRALALAAGFSEAQLFRYISGESEMPAARLLAVARAAHADPAWLLSGEGKAEGLPIPKRPEFRPELLRQLSQVLDEVMVEYPQRIASRQKSRFLAFMYEAVRHEEIRSGKPWEPGRGLMVNYLDFLCGFKDEESLSLYERFAKHAMYGEGEELSHNEQDSVGQAITTAYEHYFNGLSGETIYRRITQQVHAGNAARLQAIAALARRRFGGTSPMLLDAGCGNGRDLAYLHHIDPGLRLQGLELSPRGLRLCHSLEKTGKLPSGCVQQGDIQMIPHGSTTFEVVYSRQSPALLPLAASTQTGWRRFLAECHRVLKPGGLMFLATFAGEGQVLLPFMQLLNPASLDTLATETGFQVVERETINAAAFLQKNGFNQAIPSWLEEEMVTILTRSR